jgi:hypothetical protein
MYNFSFILFKRSKLLEMFHDFGEFADAHVTTSTRIEIAFQGQIQKELEELKLSKVIDECLLLDIEKVENFL